MALDTDVWMLRLEVTALAERIAKLEAQTPEGKAAAAAAATAAAAAARAANKDKDK